MGLGRLPCLRGVVADEGGGGGMGSTTSVTSHSKRVAACTSALAAALASGLLLLMLLSLFILGSVWDDATVVVSRAPSALAVGAWDFAAVASKADRQEWPDGRMRRGCLEEEEEAALA